ncbi:transcription elongation factor GreA [Candidatus Microgenomates bacterium]|nr:MAG: transcription elongation factor GreA [Candidatus Microgenomates bacterium]
MNTPLPKKLLTADGLAQLKSELDILVNKRRPDAVKRVATAREQGDLSENSEYAAAREDLSLIDERIVELEDAINSSKVVSSNGLAANVGVGVRVTVDINGKSDTYMIVGEWEANPKDKKISHSSPLGKALMGRKVGESITVDAPAGKITYKIVSIT